MEQPLKVTQIVEVEKGTDPVKWDSKMSSNSAEWERKWKQKHQSPTLDQTRTPKAEWRANGEMVALISIILIIELKYIIQSN